MSEQVRNTWHARKNLVCHPGTDHVYVFECIGPKAAEVAAQMLAERDAEITRLREYKALADMLRPCFIATDGWAQEMSIPYLTMDEFVRRYDALQEQA